MAVYHLSLKTGAPGKGGPHAEYILREGKYADREDFVASESGNMPAWAEHDPKIFWAAADAHERANGRVYSELEVALPRELTREQQIALVREFAENTLGQRHAYTWAIHAPQASDQEAQPHFHLMFSERRLDGIERDPDEYFRRWNPKNPERGGAGKDRYFSSQGFVWSVREEWARTANEALERAGHEARIDHRSYRDTGIDLEPSRKLGIAKHGEQRQVLAAVTAENRERAARNGERLAAAPEKAIEALTAHQSVFSRRELDNLIFRNSDSAEQFQTLKLKVLNSSELVGLTKGKGEPEFFTSRTLFEAEKALVTTADQLAKTVPTKTVRTDVRDGVAAGRGFNEGQAKAYEVLTGPTQLAAANGAAGTGKSYVLGAVREAYERSGLTVVGAALQGKTAEDLERDSGIRSSTLHSLLYRIERGDTVLDAKTVVVVDEAGLVGSAQLGQLLKHVDRAKATVRLVGDSYQLSAVAAGDAFRAVGQRASDAGVRAALTEIVRQREGWQREASAAFSEHRIGAGLQAYRERGAVIEYGTQVEARTGLLAQWDADRKARPEGTQILLAHTNRERQALNQAVREIRRAGGELGQERVVEGAAGRLELAIGDRMIFLRNDAQFGVKNGSTGTLEGLRGSRLTVRLDGGERIQVDAAQYGHIDHGYAVTVHKAQGVTVDKAYLLATDTLDAQLTYVGLTRHREAVQLAYSREHFPRGYENLVDRLSRVGVKSFSADFAELKFDRAAESGARETIAERREKQVPHIPPNATAHQVFLAKLEVMTSREIRDQVVRLRKSKGMQHPEKHPDMVRAVTKRQNIERQQSDLKAAISAAAEAAKDYRNKYGLLNGLHRVKLLRDPKLTELEHVQTEGRKALEALAKPLAAEQANVASVFERVKVEIAKLRPITEEWIKTAEQIQARKVGEEKLRSALDNAVNSRREARSGFRDGDVAWRALPEKARSLIDRLAKAPASERDALVKAQNVGELRELRIEQINSRSRGMDMSR